MVRFLLVVSLAVTTIFLASCEQVGPGSMEIDSQMSAQSTMERIALAANKCWFKSHHSTFKNYSLAPELNSYSGRPRILVVPAHAPGDRPLLVVEAEGKPAKVRLYGHLMGQPQGNQIAKDVQRWLQGDNQCR